MPISPTTSRRIAGYVSFILRSHDAGVKWVSQHPISLGQFGEHWPASLDPAEGWLACKTYSGFFCFGMMSNHHQCRLEAPWRAPRRQEGQ